MEREQVFWDAYRRRWRDRLATWRDGSGTRAWTRLIIDAAKEACRDYAAVLGREGEVGCEKYGRIDVHAADRETGDLLVAFESELAPWGWNGNSGKDWREEFRKLCRTQAELRVLSGTFTCGTGAAFPGFLRVKLDSMRADFEGGHQGAFCLIFGPESPKRDPGQAWMAFAVEWDLSLRTLSDPQRLSVHVGSFAADRVPSSRRAFGRQESSLLPRRDLARTRRSEDQENRELDGG